MASLTPGVRAHHAATPPIDQRQSEEQPGKNRSALSYAILLATAAVLCIGLLALGTWQVQRRSWKLDLIERVDQRAHALPVAVPSPDQWSQVNASADQYRRVSLSGTFLNDRETLVQASTELGSGFWVMTPLQQADGTLVLVNRGFVPNTNRDNAPDRRAGQSAVTLTGLLRTTEPVGGFLRKNDAIGNRWYSRDVKAIAAARGLTRVAPFFVDADAAATSPNVSQTAPVGGLTVIRFNNNHLVYALTWYALALMVMVAARHLVRDRRRLRQRAGDATLGSNNQPLRDAGPG